MSYHNVRDKFGRFTRKKKSRAGSKKTNVNTAKLIVPIKTPSILSGMLLDDSQSMQNSGKRVATVNGFNKVLGDSATTGIPTTEILGKFSTCSNGLKVIEDKTPLTLFSYNPLGGGTALWWAICEMITVLDNRLTLMPSDTKVMLTIFTDGENNEVFNYQERAKNMITERQARGWVIVFVGAGERDQVMKMSGSVGIFASNTANYANSGAGASAVMDQLSHSRTSYAQSVSRGSSSNSGFFGN